MKKMLIVILLLNFSFPTKSMAEQAHCLFGEEPGACSENQKAHASSYCSTWGGGGTPSCVYCSGATAKAYVRIGCGGVFFNESAFVIGDIESWDFHPVQSIPGVPGPPEPAECHFLCTGVGVSGCPYAFEEVSEINQPLECHNGDFNLVPVDGAHCNQLASNTCHQTLAPYVGSASSVSGKIGEDGSLPPSTTPPASTQPYTASQSMDDFSCLQYHPQMQLYYWIPGCFNPLLETAQSGPTQFVDPILHVQSIIGPQGEPLNMDQAFYNMAIQELIDQNSKTAAPVKK